MVIAAEGARACAALAAGFSIASSSLPVSVERSGCGCCAGTAVNSAASAVSSAARTISSAARAISSAACASAAGEIAPVIKRSAPGVVPAMVVHCVSATPIESPMAPAPSKTSEPTDSEAHSKIEVRPAKPDSGIRVPSRPRHDGISVNRPRVIGRDVHYIGVGRLNVNIRAIVPYDFLRRALKSTGLSRFVAHHLYRIHHILLLVVVSIAQS